MYINTYLFQGPNPSVFSLQNETKGGGPQEMLLQGLCQGQRTGDPAVWVWNDGMGLGDPERHSNRQDKR
jgi:hypothetical protein